MGCNCQQKKQYQAKIYNAESTNINGTVFFAVAFVGFIGAWAVLKIFDKDEDDIGEDYKDEEE